MKLRAAEEPIPPRIEPECCEGCGLVTFGEGRRTDDDVYLCGPCFDAVPLTYPCVGCGANLMAKPNMLCGECACEDDGDIW